MKGRLNLSPKSVVLEHIRGKCDLLDNHPDTVVGHLNHERSVTNDYRGRVLYELLQNAVDRAEKNIWIDFDETRKSLIIANDGEAFQHIARDNEPRSDFAAMCAIDTSNKAMGKSIGNKGVGFKSVWSLCHSVQIRTRIPEALNWGFRLHWRFKAEHLISWKDQGLANSIRESLATAKLETKHQGIAPSFYFPELIQEPEWAYENAVTAIELEHLDESACEAVRELIDDLIERPLIFVSDIRVSVELTLGVLSTHLSTALNIPLFIENKDWIRIDVPVGEHAANLAEHLKTLGVELGRPPRLALAFPKDIKKQRAKEGLVHSYLPTNQSTDSFMELQGDFYLEESRKAADFKDTPYNKLLLELACNAMLEALLTNLQGLAAEPYSLFLLHSPRDSLLQGCLLKALKGNGNRLAKIINSILSCQLKVTQRWYQELYKVLDIYTPTRSDREYHANYHQFKIKPYVDSFIEADVKLIPSVLTTKTIGDKELRIVVEALPWPKTDKEGKFVGKVFLRGRSHDAENISVPNVVVTDWIPPGNNLHLYNLLRKLDLFHTFDAIPVLRAIKDAQLPVKEGEERERLLNVAASVYSPEREYTHTHWRFIDTESVYPSQQLLVPTVGGSWCEVRRAVLGSFHPQLSHIIDKNTHHLIDELKCQQILGEQWRSILLYWGVWSCLPLLKMKKTYLSGKNTWFVAYNEDSITSIDEKLVKQSWSIWEKGEAANTKQDLEGILWQLKSLPFIQQENYKKVSPNKVFLEDSNTRIDGYYTMNSNHVCELYKRLGIKRIDETTHLVKLVSLAHRVFPKNTLSMSIKLAPLIVYRKVVKQLNRCVAVDISEQQRELLQKLPIPYEFKNGLRGLATIDEGNVWYLPGQLRSSKNKFLDASHKVWLITGDVTTLAKLLQQVELFVLNPKTIQCDDHFDVELLRVLKTDYLPKFLALVNYSDSVGGESIDETLIERRWSKVSTYRTDKAILQENTVDGDGNDIVLKTDIQQQGWLWRPYYNDVPTALKLYALEGLDVGKHPEVLCRWFADEIFRRRDLADKFERVLTEPSSYGLGEALIKDAEELVDSWLSSDDESRLIDYVESKLGADLDGGQWRDPAIYVHYRIDFKQLYDEAPISLKRIIQLLDPREANKAELDSFLEEHANNIGALEPPLPNNKYEWLAQFSKEPERTNFAFDARQWLLGKTGLNAEAFKALGGKIDHQLQQLRDESTALNINKAKPDEANVIFKVEPKGMGNSRRTNSLIAIKNDNERIKTQLAKSKDGKNIEKKFALLCARDVCQLEPKVKSVFFALLKQEFDRSKVLATKQLSPEFKRELEQLLEMPAEEHTENTWKTLMHIGAIADGAGYDVIRYSVEDEQLQLVEVKSCKAHELCIHLSENERQKALDYLTSEFKQHYPLLVWRMYFVNRKGHYDITDALEEVLIEHQQQFIEYDKFVPESWLLTGLEIKHLAHLAVINNSKPHHVVEANSVYKS